MNTRTPITKLFTADLLCLLFGMAFACAHLSAFANPNVSGIWEGSSSCAGSNVDFKVEISGTTGTLQLTLVDKSQAGRPITVGSYRNSKGLWITLPSPNGEGPLKHLEGLLSADQRSIQFFQGFPLEDCMSFTMRKRATSAPPLEQVNRPAPPNPERRAPTSDEVLSALKYAISGGDSAATQINNPISGMTISIENFELLGCEKAASAPGYICDFMINTDMKMHSNEGTSAGDSHAHAMNQLISALSAARPAQPERGRFVYVAGRKRWMKMTN